MFLIFKDSVGEIEMFQRSINFEDFEFNQNFLSESSSNTLQSGEEYEINLKSIKLSAKKTLLSKKNRADNLVFKSGQRVKPSLKRKRKEYMKTLYPKFKRKSSKGCMGGKCRIF